MVLSEPAVCANPNGRIRFCVVLITLLPKLAKLNERIIPSVPLPWKVPEPERVEPLPLKVKEPRARFAYPLLVKLPETVNA